MECQGPRQRVEENQNEIQIRRSMAEKSILPIFKNVEMSMRICWEETSRVEKIKCT